jgi:nucleoside-diphosphate-sugar epimerase
MHKLKMFKAIKNGRFPLIGGGKSLLHPTYVDDIIDGFMLVVDNPAAFGKTFHLAGPKPVTVEYLTSVICTALDTKQCRLRIPTPAAKAAATGAEITARALKKTPVMTRYQVDFFSRDHTSDISLARALLGYQPNVNIEEGIKYTIGWYKEQGFL